MQPNLHFLSVLTNKIEKQRTTYSLALDGDNNVLLLYYYLRNLPLSVSYDYHHQTITIFRKIAAIPNKTCEPAFAINNSLNICWSNWQCCHHKSESGSFLTDYIMRHYFRLFRLVEKCIRKIANFLTQELEKLCITDDCE